MLKVHKLSKLYNLHQRNFMTFNNVINDIDFTAIRDIDFFENARVSLSNKINFYHSIESHLTLELKIKFTQNLLKLISNSYENVNYLIDLFLLIRPINSNDIRSILKDNFLKMFIDRTRSSVSRMINQPYHVLLGYKFDPITLDLILYSIKCLRISGIIENIIDLKKIINSDTIDSERLNSFVKIVYDSDNSLYDAEKFNKNYILSNTLKINILDLDENLILINNMDIL